MTRRQILLDVDPGIDDAVMMLQLAAEPSAEIVAVGSTHGNCPAAVAAANAIRVLDVLDLDHVPVALGADSPLEHRRIGAPHVHGTDGLADAGLPPPSRDVSGESAVAQMIRLSHERPGELDLIAVGAMTNLGLALLQDPTVLTRFRTVAILGTYSRHPRPGDPETVDANIFNSPAAADDLFAAQAPLLVVPVDTTNHSILEDNQIERLRRATTPHGQFAWRILPFYFDFYQTMLGHWTARMHDSLTAAVLLDPSLIEESVRRPLYVERIGEFHRAVGHDPVGATTLPPRPAVEIVTKVDQRRFLDRLVDCLTVPLGTLPPVAS